MPYGSKSFAPMGANVPAANGAPVAQGSIAVTTAVQQVPLSATSASDKNTIRIVVDGASSIAWCCGINPLLTMSNGVPMLGNTIETFTIPDNVSQLSVIGSAAGSTIRVLIGEGE